MKYLIFFLLLVVQMHGAKNRTWSFERINLYLENDAGHHTDIEYSDGARFSVLMHRPDAVHEDFHIPFTEVSERTHFISFALTRQMFTPDDLTESKLIEDQRPYAGWLYLETALHQTTVRTLDTLTMQLGIVGPASGVAWFQKQIHNIIGVTEPQGWDNQLNNEIGIQLNYQHKRRYLFAPVWGIESCANPYIGTELGNVSIKANTGALLRIGWHIPEDFGAGIINGGYESGIPVRAGSLSHGSSKWSLYGNLHAGGSVVARDLFLDGNTFTESHSVDKKFFTGYGSYGVSGRYKNFSFDYLRTYYTKQYTTQEHAHRYDTIILSYLF